MLTKAAADTSASFAFEPRATYKLREWSRGWEVVAVVYRPAFIDEVKRATLQVHDESKESLFATSLMAGELDPSAFAQWLLALLPVYTTLETSLIAQRSDPWIHIFDHRKLDRRRRIANDLQFLGFDPDTSPSTLPASSAYSSVVQEASQDPVRLLAHHYTRYLGDMIGGRVIARCLDEKYGIDAAGRTCYDFSELGDVFHYRKQYRVLVDLMPWSTDERSRFIDETQAAYRVNRLLFDELAVATGCADDARSPVG